MAKVFQFITSPLSIIDKDFAKGAQAVALIVAGIVTGNPAFIMAGAARGASLFEKAPGIPASQIDRLNASVDPRAFRKTVLGQTAMPVDIRYEEWSGKDQDYCDWIVLHASHACDGLEEIWFDTEMAWSATTGVVGKYAGYFSVPHIVLEGSPTNAFTIASGKWNAASARLTGCAYSHWRFKVSPNSKKSTSPFASGLPSRITVIGRGAKLYDPRRDSTVPGGSGPMRADDQSTWRYTADDGAVIGENLPLHALRVVLGWRIRNPATGEMMLATGSGVPPRRLDLASWITAANLADEAVNRSAGGTEPRYHGASVVSEGDDPKSTLDMICTGCCGRFRDTGGRLSFDIAHNDLAVAATDDGLTDDDVIGGWTWDPDAALESTPNVVRGRYVDATTASLYQMIDYPEVRLASPDGQDRIFPLDLGVVESPSQAQRIAKQVLQRKQYPRAFTATFDIRAWKYGVGDVVPFTFAPLGFNRRLFRVQEQELGQGGACVMTLTVETAAIYAWDKDDAAPVLGAEPIVYDSRLNPLVLAIDEAATTANWSSVTGVAKPADYADVTADAIDHSRFALCTSADRIGTEIRSRFDPVFWTCNFPNTMIASLRASGDTLQADAVFHQRDHLLGIIWESVDRWDHPTTGYDTDRDYRGCQLSFRLQLTGSVLPIDDVAGPVLTIEGRDATGAARTWYVRLANLVTSGGSRDARIRIDFDALRGGFYADDPVFAGDIDRMFLSLVPEGYSAGGGRLSGPTEGGLILSEMVALGSRATLTCGTGPGGVHEVRMTNGYDDTYNVSPARIVRNLRLLGYKDRLVQYVGMSHYFRWSWNSGEDRYIAEDVTEPLNRPCVLWHADFAARLRTAGIQLVLSLSYEMLDSFAPAAFRQRDASGAPALTGWSPPSTLFSPCHAGAMAYLQRVARQFSAIAAQAGHPVHFQVGEPWYWIDFRSRVPYFYDAATTAAYLAATGKTAPRIDTMTAAMTADQIAYLDWLGGRLAASILALLAAVRADHPQAVRYALLYLPQMLDTATPEAMRVNLPKALAWPALDVLQLEDYDYVIDNRPDLSATGRAVAEQRLGYPRSRQEYFAGFALHRDTGQIWRQTTNAMQAAYEHGVFPIYVWAYTQVMRDGYAPRLLMAPALGVADIHDIDLTAEPDDGAVLVFNTKRRKWVPGKPWLANT